MDNFLKTVKNYMVTLIIQACNSANFTEIYKKKNFNSKGRLIIHSYKLAVKLK
jgi:hypothetical protein